MIRIVMNRLKHTVELELPTDYERVLVCLWKLGLDRDPRKYTLRDLKAVFHYDTPEEHQMIRMIESGDTLMFALISLLLAVAAILVIWDVVAPPDPDECSICGHLKCHAPCILNLATGEIGELELYQPHFQKVGEIAEEQTGSTFSFIHLAGLQGIKLTDPWYIEVDVPMEGERKNNTFFCDKCRKLLREYEKGYILIDMYDLQNPVVYSFEDGGSYEIRCYQITTSAKWSSEAYLLRVDGLFHEK